MHLSVIRRSIFFCVLAIRLAAADQAAFTYGRWHTSEAGGGGYINNIIVNASDPQRLYAALDVSGLARSDDGGTSWHLLQGAWPDQLGVTGARDVDSDPRNRDVVLAVLGNQWAQSQAGIWRSENGGRSWRLAGPAPVAGDEPHRSAGRTIARSPHDPDLILVATIGDGIRRSTDGGKTWLAGGPSGVHGTGIVWDTHRPARAWLCAQRTKMALSTRDNSSYPEAENDGGVFVTVDSGATWNRLASEGPSELVPDPRRADQLWGLAQSRLVSSRDAGVTWQDASNGLPVLPQNAEWMCDGRFQALAAGPDFILAGSARGSAVYRTPAGGDPAWTIVRPAQVSEIAYGRPWYRKAGWDGSSRSSLVIDPTNPRRWYSTDWFGIYRSDDGGGHWRLVIDGIENTCLHHLLQDPADPGIVHLAMADNGYLRSEDGGATFMPAGQGLSNNVKTIVLSPREPRRLYATATATWHWRADAVYVSVDRGDTWIKSPLLGIPEADNRRCNSIEVHPDDPLDVYLGVTVDGDGPVNGVYRSRDGGRTWTSFSEGLPRQQRLFRNKDIWGIGRELACSGNGALVGISHELAGVWRRGPGDGGWTKVTFPGAAPTSVLADWSRPGRFWLVADGVWRSDDGGASWMQSLKLPAITLQRGEAGHLAIDRRNPQRLAIGTPSGPRLSTDGGTTWQAIGADLPNRLGNLVAFAGERLLVGSTGNGALWTALSPQGEARVQAKAIAAPAYLSTRADALVAQPAGPWAVVWRGKGEVSTLPQGVAVSDGGEGSAALALPITGDGLALAGRLRCTGALTRVVLAVEGFDANGKQCGWTTVLETSTTPPVTTLSTPITPPPRSSRLQLVLLLCGSGTAVVEDLKLVQAPAVFSTP